MGDYTEPVLQALGTLRDLTFKSGEKAASEKHPGEKNANEQGDNHQGQQG